MNEKFYYQESDIQERNKKLAKEYLKKVINECLKKDLSFDVHADCEVINVRNKDFSFNFSSYYSLALSNYSDSSTDRTITMKELFEKVKNYKL